MFQKFTLPRIMAQWMLSRLPQMQKRTLIFDSYAQQRAWNCLLWSTLEAQPWNSLKSPHRELLRWASLAGNLFWPLSNPICAQSKTNKSISANGAPSTPYNIFLMKFSRLFITWKYYSFYKASLRWNVFENSSEFKKPTHFTCICNFREIQ